MRSSTRHARAAVFCAAVCLALLPLACSDDESTLTTPADVPAGVVSTNPDVDQSYVGLDEDIWIVYDRPLEDAEIQATDFSINGQPVVQVVHERFPAASKITLVPGEPLEYHKMYTVRVHATGESGLAGWFFRFATDPGPAGLVWERRDAPAGVDLLKVSETSWGYIAIGRNGSVLRSGWRFDWGSVSYIAEAGGPPETGDLVWMWPANRSSVLTSAGDVYVGDGIGRWMSLWTPPADLHILGMWSVTDVYCGSLRSDSTMGFVTTSYPGAQVVQTGQGRVMRAASYGYDGANFYLAVGDDGSIFFTRNRVDWQDVHHEPALGTLRAVRGGFPNSSPASQVPRINVAAGDGIAWSEDAINWTAVTIPSLAPLHDIAWDGYPDGEFVVVGENGTILRSADGKVWVPIDTGLDLGGATLYGVWTTSKWVVVGEGGLTIVSPPSAIQP